MYKFFNKTVSILYVKLGGKEIEANRIRRVLEEFSDDDEINDYNLDKTAGDLLVEAGILKIEGGSRQAVLYCKTDKFEEFYTNFMDNFYEEAEGRKQGSISRVQEAVEKYDCDVSVFKCKYRDYIIMMVGRSGQIEGIERYINEGQIECSIYLDRLRENTELPVYIGDSILKGITEIESKIIMGTQDRGLQDYIDKVCRVYEDILEN